MRPARLRQFVFLRRRGGDGFAACVDRLRQRPRRRMLRKRLDLQRHAEIGGQRTEQIHLRQRIHAEIQFEMLVRTDVPADEFLNTSGNTAVCLRIRRGILGHSRFYGLAARGGGQFLADDVAA